MPNASADDRRDDAVSSRWPGRARPHRRLRLEALSPRLPEQPIFYPVENEEYARQIAGDWNVRSSGAGYVLRFTVDADCLARFPVQQVGTATHREYWIPAEELETFNDHIVGAIELIASYPRKD